MYPSTSSGLKSADTQITSRNSKVHSVILIADGTNAATLTLYDTDTGTATGTELIKISIKATDTFEMFHADGAVEAKKGIWADVSGTGAAFIVHYSHN